MPALDVRQGEPARDEPSLPDPIGRRRRAAVVVALACSYACAAPPAPPAAQPAIARPAEPASAAAPAVRPPSGLEELTGEADTARAPERPAMLVFRWPIEKVSISSPFGVRRNPFHYRRGRKRIRRRGTGWHGGVDLNGHTGDQVFAAAGGQVVHAGWYYGYGKHVAIQHAGGYLTRYGHLSEILVFPGQRVRAGAPIGLVGSTGRSTGPHLHFTLERGGKGVDPLAYIGRPLEVGDEHLAGERVAQGSPAGGHLRTTATR